MPLLLDHIFILSTPGATEAESIAKLGLVEGNASVHPGQGTANRRFFLPDFTVELLYVCDSDEAANGAGKGLGILERSLDREASPFGLVVRVADGETSPGFPNWQYTPDYFDGEMCFFVGENSSLTMEPLCICMPPALPKRSNIPSEFENPEWKLSNLTIATPVAEPSETLKLFSAMEKVEVEYGKPHHMTLTFNDGVSKSVKDLRPELPLTIEY